MGPSTAAVCLSRRSPPRRLGAKVPRRRWTRQCAAALSEAFPVGRTLVNAQLLSSGLLVLTHAAEGRHAPSNFGSSAHVFSLSHVAHDTCTDLEARGSINASLA